MNTLYQHKHELWLDILFASFTVNDAVIKDRLYDFAMIAFRHLKWVGSDLLAQGDDYNYDRSRTLLKRQNNFEIFNFLKEQITLTQAYYGEGVLFERMITDEAYLDTYLTALLSDPANNHAVTAFDMHRTIDTKQLDAKQTDALTIFLFEESYKEYELILVYAYMQARTKALTHFNVFQDLIDESHFHLKSFGNMLAKMGILALPRELHELTYKVTDMNKFVENGIQEEMNAKEECRKLAAEIADDELTPFFDFINFQENYHIELMKRLL